MTGMLKTVLRDMRILRGFLIGLGRAMASCAESSDNVNGIANVFVSAIRIIGQRKLLCICINSYTFKDKFIFSRIVKYRNTCQNRVTAVLISLFRSINAYT